MRMDSLEQIDDRNEIVEYIVRVCGTVSIKFDTFVCTVTLKAKDDFNATSDISI
jgi:hypothetical protein